MALQEIVGAAEAADILGIGNTNFSHLRKQRAGTEDAFPEPAVQLKCGPIWLKRDVDKYAKTFKPGRRPAAKVEQVEAKPESKIASKTPAKAPTKTVAKKTMAVKKIAAKKSAAKRHLALAK